MLHTCDAMMLTVLNEDDNSNNEIFPQLVSVLAISKDVLYL